MNPFRLMAATALLAFAGATSAQVQNPDARDSRDVSPPAGGAITGGSATRRDDPEERSNTPKDEALRRCNDLQGILREDCVRSSGSGATTVPADKAPAGGSDIGSRVSPPPQNPR